MSSRDRRRREKKSRERLFIDVAQKLFLEHGYERTTIEQIARAAEFSKRTVYLYFESKHDLFSAVVLRCLSHFQERLDAVVDPALSGRDQIVELARAYSRTALDSPDAFRLVMEFERRDYHYGKSGDSMGPFARLCFEVNDALGELLANALRRGDADGSFRTNLEPHQFSLLMWSALVGVLQVAVWRRDILHEAYGLDAMELAEGVILNLVPAPRSGVQTRDNSGTREHGGTREQ